MSAVNSTPSNWFILSHLVSIIRGSKSPLHTSSLPSTTVPASSSWISWAALSIALSTFTISISFSKRLDASLLRPRAFEVSLTLPASNLALSKMILVVSDVISVLSPPITPAIPMAFSGSAIISISSVRFLSWPSRVINFSSFLAFLTIIVLLATLSISKACMGWPISSIT